MLDVAAPVVTYFPEFGANDKGTITVEQVMTHTSGFPRAPLPPAIWADHDARVARMAAWRLNWEPGTRFEYHPTPERQHDVARLQLTGEEPSPDELERVFGVRTYDRGEVTNEALMLLDQPDDMAAGLPGGGGVSDAADIVRYYQALLHNPGELWDPASLVDVTRRIRCTLPDPLLGHPSNRSLGLIVAGDDGRSNLRGMGHNVSAQTFGHNGAAGQIAWADPASGLSFCYLTNGIDQNFLRDHRRTSGIASRAGLLTTVH